MTFLSYRPSIFLTRSFTDDHHRLLISFLLTIISITSTTHIGPPITVKLLSKGKTHKNHPFKGTNQPARQEPTLKTKSSITIADYGLEFEYSKISQNQH